MYLEGFIQRPSNGVRKHNKYTTEAGSSILLRNRSCECDASPVMNHPHYYAKGWLGRAAGNVTQFTSPSHPVAVSTRASSELAPGHMLPTLEIEPSRVHRGLDAWCFRMLPPLPMTSTQLDAAPFIAQPQRPWRALPSGSSTKPEMSESSEAPNCARGVFGSVPQLGGDPWAEIECLFPF